MGLWKCAKLIRNSRVVLFVNLFETNWCERRDSNSHGLPRWNLNPVRLPVPPLSPAPIKHRRGNHYPRPREEGAG
jgi:hypothetical protein